MPTPLIRRRRGSTYMSGGVPTLRDFINNVADKLVEGGFIERRQLETDIAMLELYLSRPDALVTSHMFFQLCGRIPG
jgi:hypothetical protein